MSGTDCPDCLWLLGTSRGGRRAGQRLHSARLDEVACVGPRTLQRARRCVGAIALCPRMCLARFAKHPRSHFQSVKPRTAALQSPDVRASKSQYFCFLDSNERGQTVGKGSHRRPRSSRPNDDGRAERLHWTGWIMAVIRRPLEKRRFFGAAVPKRSLSP